MGTPDTDTADASITTSVVSQTLDDPESTTTTPAPKPRISTYFIGNSLTHQTLGALRRFLSWYVLATQADVVAKPLGWHIRCGSSLNDTASNPDDTCVDPSSEAGPFPEALSQDDWDFVSYQPYPGEGSTFATDIEVITSLSTALPDQTTIVIFGGWPPVEGFAESWTQQLDVNDDTPTTAARAYFDTLVQQLEAEIENEILLAPSGEALYRLDAEARIGCHFGNRRRR